MKDWRKRLEDVGGYENEYLAVVPTPDVREMVDEIEKLREFIRYYSYVTRQGVRASESASYTEWENKMKELGFNIP